MKELKDYQKRLLEKFNPKKPVIFRYYVTDCEHLGDISYYERKCRKYVETLGGKITETYWDGEDCGEAWIECTIPFDKLEQAFRDRFFDYDPWQ